MKIFNSIQLKNSESEIICRNCVHFQDDPVVIEETYRGLTTMSSGFASVRDKDGLCNYNQLYLSARDSCTSFQPLLKSNEKIISTGSSEKHLNK